MNDYIIKQPKPSISYEFSEGGLHLKAILMYESEFTDVSGKEFTATRDFFERIKTNYEAYLQDSVPSKVVGVIKRVMGRNVEPRFAPVLTDHDPTEAMNKKGHVISLFIEENDGLSVLLCDLLITDKTTIEKIKCGCLREVSMAFGLAEDDEPELKEVSLVVRGAVPGAMVLMSKHLKNKRKRKVTHVLEDVKKELEKDNKEIELCERELKLLNLLSQRGGRSLKFLDTLVKEGCISKAAKKVIHLKMCDKDKKTQNIVLDVLQTFKRYSTVNRGHQADLKGAMAMEEYLKQFSSRGENMIISESSKAFEEVRAKAKGEKTEGEQTETQQLLSQFSALFQEINVLKDSLTKLKKRGKERDATLDEVLGFMKQGEFGKAVKLAEKSSKENEDTMEFSDTDDEEIETEITSLKKRLKKLRFSSQRKLMNFMTKLMDESEDEYDFGCTSDEKIKGKTRKTRKASDDDDEDVDVHVDVNSHDGDDDDDDDHKHKKARKHKASEKDDDDDHKTRKHSRKMRDDDDDDDDDDDTEHYRKHKKRKMSDEADDDDKDDDEIDDDDDVDDDEVDKDIDKDRKGRKHRKKMRDEDEDKDRRINSKHRKK